MKENQDSLLKKEYYVSLLLIYGRLLTENIYHRMELYYLMDYSITEISECDKVSRNAVFEALDQGCRKLDSYETKLRLYQKNRELTSALENILSTEDASEKDRLLRKLKGEIENGI